MNKSNFILTGGYPLKAERLQELQTAYSIFNSLGALAGNLTIISGCVVAGTNVGDGFVYIEGELYEFKGGAFDANSTVIIVEETINRGFKNGVVKQVHTIRYATFGTADVSWPWANFYRCDTLKSIQSRLLPPGTNPQLYCGSVTNIPTGWQLCDGTNGTPNLKNKFIVGYDPDDTDYNDIGKTGGEKKHTLTVLEMPSHSHSFTKENTRGAGSSGAEDGSSSFETAETQATGGGQAHENRPPYYTLAYIIYVG